MSANGAAIPRYRPFAGPALFQHGFRPFFLSAGLWSAIALALWVATLAGAIAPPTVFSPLAWHIHEMLFGFTTAAAAGFLLTAVPNWTGRMPLQGWPLIGLWTVWLAGRMAVLIAANIGAGAAMVIDLAFTLLLLVVVVREIVAGRNWRNLPVAIAIGMLFVANLLMHLEAVGIAGTLDTGWRLGIGVFAVLIALVGGRITPSFTRNWLSRRGQGPLPASFGLVDRGALGLTLLAAVAWVALPDNRLTAILSLFASAALFVRLARWQGHRTLGEPLLWSLHLGYAWLPTGFALIALAQFLPGQISATAAIHAFTAGAFGTMTLAVMTRATLGHTGRALTAGLGTLLIYVLATIAALARVAAPLIAPELYMPTIHIAGTGWVAAFALYVVLYIVPLAQPRRRG